MMWWRPIMWLSEFLDWAVAPQISPLSAVLAVVFAHFLLGWI